MGVFLHTGKKSITERKNPFILSNCINNSAQHINYSKHTGVIHKCPGVNDRKNPQQTGYTGSLQVASLKLLHSVDHDTQEKKSMRKNPFILSNCITNST